MAIGASAVCNSFKSEVLQALHNFTIAGGGGDTFKLAMFTNASSISASTTAYTAPADPAADPTSTKTKLVQLVQVTHQQAEKH